MHNDLCMQSDIYVFVFATITCALAVQALCYLPLLRLFFVGAIVSVLWQVEEKQWNLIFWTPGLHDSHTPQFHYYKGYEEKVDGNL